jgi:hypothetical protein
MLSSWLNFTVGASPDTFRKHQTRSAGEYHALLQYSPYSEVDIIDYNPRTLSVAVKVQA